MCVPIRTQNSFFHVINHVPILFVIMKWEIHIFRSNNNIYTINECQKLTDLHSPHLPSVSSCHPHYSSHRRIHHDSRVMAAARIVPTDFYPTVSMTMPRIERMTSSVMRISVTHFLEKTSSGKIKSKCSRDSRCFAGSRRSLCTLFLFP